MPTLRPRKRSCAFYGLEHDVDTGALQPSNWDITRAACVPISMRTFQSYLAEGEWEKAVERIGFRTRQAPRNGMRLGKEDGVTYYTSTYLGKPCLILRFQLLVFAPIEYLFLEKVAP